MVAEMKVMLAVFGSICAVLLIGGCGGSGATTASTNGLPTAAQTSGTAEKASGAASDNGRRASKDGAATVRSSGICFKANGLLLDAGESVSEVTLANASKAPSPRILRRAVNGPLTENVTAQLRKATQRANARLAPVVRAIARHAKAGLAEVKRDPKKLLEAPKEFARAQAIAKRHRLSGC